MKMMNPEDELLKPTLSDRASEIAENLGEVAHVQLLDPSVLSDIPIPGTGISLFRLGNNVQAYLFTKKICTFFRKLKVVPVEKRQELCSKMINKEGFSSKGGEILLFILARVNSTESS